MSYTLMNVTHKLTSLTLELLQHSQMQPTHQLSLNLVDKAHGIHKRSVLHVDERNTGAHNELNFGVGAAFTKAIQTSITAQLRRQSSQITLLLQTFNLIP
ncbi:hypothetical protein J6590_059380 [Homalodisca vitripennis]|nr:hypothetical protein J6590_059380 [Homalodisca vitripennis]